MWLMRYNAHTRIKIINRAPLSKPLHTAISRVIGSGASARTLLCQLTLDPWQLAHYAIMVNCMHNDDEIHAFLLQCNYNPAITSHIRSCMHQWPGTARLIIILSGAT